MLIRVPRGWELPERLAAPEAHFFDRRRLLQGFGLAAAGMTIGACDLSPQSGPAPAQAGPDPSLGRYPVARNPRYVLDRPVTDVGLTSRYNNFYEFGSHKQIADAAQALPIRPWTIQVKGEVETPFTIGIDDLLGKLQLEERLYRHRCVERWAMAVPWTGFSMRSFVDQCRPKSGARYIRMESFQNSEVATGQRQSWYPWPYSEGLTMAEATHELAFLATGVYGKPLLKQFGAPIRLAVPWKYGFKSIKSIVSFEFLSGRPESFWERIQPQEYGFWANVNPQVPHPRWSQAQERVLGEAGYRPTQIFNGYGAFVADLYTGLEGEALYR